MGHRLNPKAPEYISPNYNNQIPTIPDFVNASQICVYAPFQYTSQPFIVSSLLPPPPPPPPPQILTVDYHYVNDQPVVVNHPPQRFISNPSGRTRVSHVNVGDKPRNFNNNNNYINNKRIWKRRSSFDGKSKNVVYVKKGDNCSSSTSHRERRNRSSNSDINADSISENVTTLMIRNIPSKYTRRMLMEFVDEHCKLQNKSNVNQHHAYDFLYLPIDFRSKLNKGYGFINFTSPEASSTFAAEKNHQKWPFFNSSKIREISFARLQGKDVMMRNYENMRFACKEQEFLPVFFKPPRDGTNQDLVTEQIVGIYFGNN